MTWQPTGNGREEQRAATARCPRRVIGVSTCHRQRRTCGNRRMILLAGRRKDRAPDARRRRVSHPSISIWADRVCWASRERVACDTSRFRAEGCTGIETGSPGTRQHRVRHLVLAGLRERSGERNRCPILATRVPIPSCVGAEFHARPVGAPVCNCRRTKSRN